LEVAGARLAKKARTVPSSSRSFHSAFSARRRNSGECGQLGLAAMKLA
jgi:hypothetical protein